MLAFLGRCRTNNLAVALIQYGFDVSNQFCLIDITCGPLFDRTNCHEDQIFSHAYRHGMFCVVSVIHITE